MHRVKAKVNNLAFSTTRPLTERPTALAPAQQHNSTTAQQHRPVVVKIGSNQMMWQMMWQVMWQVLSRRCPGRYQDGIATALRIDRCAGDGLVSRAWSVHRRIEKSWSCGYDRNGSRCRKFKGLHHSGP